MFTNRREHFKDLIKQFGKVKKLGQRRFEELISSFNPSIEEINELIEKWLRNTRK
jgi:hypothetical protein